jgi:SecD/SecF fusion protein
MKPFIKRILICLTPVVLSAVVVGMAWKQYVNGEGGFKPGVDLVGGTILVYEIDRDKATDQKFSPEELAAALKRRIDPTDLLNVTIRPLSDTRVEIILPYGGAYQAKLEEERWQAVLTKVRDKWPQLKDANLDVPRGRTRELALAAQHEVEKQAWTGLLAEVGKKWPDKLKEFKLDSIPVGRPTELREALKKAGIDEKDVDAFFKDHFQKQYEDKLVKVEDFEKVIKENYQVSADKKNVSGEEVQRIKDLISQVGSLEFRIAANDEDDRDAIAAARSYIEAAVNPNDPEAKRAERKRELENAANRGLPPPPPRNAEGGKNFHWKTDSAEGDTSYTWVELDRSERHSLGLNNSAKDDRVRSRLWQQAAQDRDAGRCTVLESMGGALLYSRRCTSFRLTPQEQADKQFEYFLLTRDPQPGEEIKSGKYRLSATAGQDEALRPSVNFSFDQQGGNLFGKVTAANRPSEKGGKKFNRFLAIVLDDKIISAPALQAVITTQGRITGNFTNEDVKRMVTLLRSGALPATLKPLPVSENTIGPTLGADTVDRGLKSIILAFLAVLAFMVVYYRFAGLVASIALFANLLLTIAFMVLVQATFTLPGIAGLVLTVGMAVDANVLIYERLREERDRGASLALAIRNGYDRSFGTIIDTHLSSIFTAIILYVVGNDQLKGFGISLTVGLLISLFTSLYMTRTIFDFCLAKGWLTELRMFRLFSKPNIDFMRVRHYWFTATILLTVLGLGVVLLRGNSSLNIDFIGGTAYTAHLKEGVDISKLRTYFDEEHQKERLAVTEVQQSSPNGLIYDIGYKGSDGKETVQLTNVPPGQTNQEREANVLARASQLPDWAVEQIILPSEAGTGTSTLFNVRTSEKSPDLVQVMIARLLQDNGKSLLSTVTITDFKVDGRRAVLDFSDFASPGQVKMLLERAAQSFPEGKKNATYDLVGEGKSKDGRYKRMRLEITGPDADRLDEADVKGLLEKTRDAFAKRPVPERLENFDSQLAADTQTRALYAILASWAALLFYIWFRFGNWTFGLAAVLCLVHDVVFTLGILAFCHYICVWTPWLANILLLEDFKIDLPTVAALLTLVGYSINDKIVVYDRMREVRGKKPELTAEIINESINQALSRTVLTGLSVMLVLTVLYVFGGPGIHLFAFVMLIGLIIGTYSSIYIASPLLLIFGEGKTMDFHGASSEKATKADEEEEEAGDEEGEEESEAEEEGKAEKKP